MFWFLLLMGVIAYVCTRASKHDYTIGSGMFKSSNFNIDEKDEFADKSYYDNDGIMK
jgi:hypothetical protein